MDMFSNPKLLSYIQDAKWTLTLYCNSRKDIFSKRGDLKGYGTIWYHSGSIANILSFSNVHKKHKESNDSSQKTGVVVHKVMFFSDVKGDVEHVLFNTYDKKKINSQLNSTLIPIKPDLPKTL